MPWTFEAEPTPGEKEGLELLPEQGKEVLELIKEIREKIKIQREGYDLRNPREVQNYLKELDEFVE